MLVVEDNEIDSSQIAKILQDDDICKWTLLLPEKKRIRTDCRNNHYDCIILDYTLPDISGIEL